MASTNQPALILLTDGIYPYVIGGMQRHSYYLAKYLAKNGVYVDLYHTWQNKDVDIHQLAVFSEDEKKFIHSIVIDFPKAGRLPGHYLVESYQYSEKIFNELKKNINVDFIYVKGFSGWKLLEEKKKGMKLPPVGVNFHGYEAFQMTASIKSKIEQNLLLRKPILFNVRNADYIFSYGGKITTIIQQIGIAKDRIIEIPAGIESIWLTDAISLTNKKRKFIFIGRHERRKGINELNKVLSKLIKTNDFEFQFVGPIPDKLKLESEKIKYWGQITDEAKIKTILHECDVLVCPSYSEGMPNVILEAMSQGLAIIATDVGAVNKMVSKNNGWLINVGNQELLKSTILQAIQIPILELEDMKTNSKSVVEKFLWENIILKLIDQICEKLKK